MAHPCVEPVGGIDVEIKPPLQSKYFNPALLAGFVLKNLTQKQVGVDEGVGVFVGVALCVWFGTLVLVGVTVGVVVFVGVLVGVGQGIIKSQVSLYSSK